MKKFCALLALAVMLALLPAAALALPRTVIYVLGVPDDVSEVQLLFADAPAPCVETKAGWGWSGPLRDPGGITGVSLLWPDGETYSAVRGDLEITKDACGTLYVRLTDVAAPQRYAVTYQYTGVVPPGAPALPAEKSYKAGAAVAVAAAPSFDGYEFSGWSVPELEVTDGTFSMPAHGVVLKGGFSKLYTVRYAYGGDVPAAAPPVPAPERHAQGDTVTAAAAPSSGDYDFSGWSTRDAELTAGVFSMPGGDVLLTGTFSPKPRCSVTYRYTGEVPAGAPALPAARSYKAGARVSVAAAPSLAGYVFSGWTTADAVVADGEFDMPAKAVVFTGAFTAAAPARYDVTYVYAGDVPAGAPAPPAAQSYAAGARVSVAAAPPLAGYVFSGWTTADAAVAGGEFDMPARAVVFTGSFARLYAVTYAYAGAIPSGAPALPDAESYTAGALVRVKGAPSLSGYTFSGWKTADAAVSGGTFVMPDKDVALEGSFGKNAAAPDLDSTPDTGVPAAGAFPPAAGLPAALLTAACALRARRRRQ